MRRLLSICFYLAALILICLAQYEITERSAAFWGGPWPGWEGAAFAERVTPWHPRTGLPLLDHALHEGTEATIYYRWLLTGSTEGALAAALEVDQHG